MRTSLTKQKAKANIRTVSFAVCNSLEKVMQAIIKGLSPEVAKEVGKSAAIMLQQLIQWFKSKTVVKVYRTNEEMFSDLNGVLSVATIQRCKQRLLEKGYVKITFDKGLNRTTHYELTEKGVALLEASKSQRNAVQASSVQSGTDVPQKPKTGFKSQSGANKKHVSDCKSNYALEHNTSMKKSFEEAGVNKNAIACPADLLSIVKRKVAKPVTEVEEVKVEEPKAEDQSWEEIVKDEMEMQAEDFEADMISDEDYMISDEDYAEIELSMLAAIEKHAEPVEKSTSLSDLMKTAYSKAATEAQELMFAMKQEQQYFCEDF